MFEAISGFLQFADKAFVAGLKPKQLSHEDLFLKRTIKKHVMDIKLLKRLLLGNSQGDYQVDSDRFNNRGESFIVVKAKWRCILEVC